nr:LacI family DNA-binding transcriptional regulator [uncultured Schaedlerella sp.]
MQKQAPLTKAPTIYDVALEAGVSPATVSRVMNHYSQVKRDTSEKVIATMKKLDFQRNEAKSAPQLLGSSVNRALPSNQPRVFVLSIPHTASSPYAAFIEGAQTAAQKNGHHLLINSTPVDRYNFDFFIATMKSHNIAGILTTETIAAPDLSGINDHLPLVQCGEYNASVEQLSSISIDDTATARSAAECPHALSPEPGAFVCAGGLP